MSVARSLSWVVSLGVAGCSRDVVLEMKFQSTSLSRATTRLEAYIFQTVDGDPEVTCAQLDPRGAPPLPAPQRAHLEPAFSSAGGRWDAFETFHGLPSGAWVASIDAYGPPCLRVAVSPDTRETVCAELATGDANVLRAHGCAWVDGEGETAESVLTLGSMAPLGSEMKGTIAAAYTERAPLVMVEGLTAHEDLVVQLIDDHAADANGVKVSWSFEKGEGEVDGPSVRETGSAIFSSRDQARLEQEGISRVKVRAGVSASELDGGRMRIVAHAPGYEGSPAVFDAKAVRGIDVERESLITTLAKTTDLVPRFFPVVVEDLDGDGRAEIVFARLEGRAGTGMSRVIVLRREDARWRIVTSEPIPGEVTAISAVRLGALAARGLAVFTVADTDRNRIVVDPAMWLFGLSQGALMPLTSRIVEELPCSVGSCAAERSTKMTIALDARDIDDDGVDELAVSRCSFAISYGNSPKITCLVGANGNAQIDQPNDDEVGVLRIEGEGPTRRLRRISAFRADVIGGARTRGGFGEVRFADLNGDRQVDLVFAQPLETVAICGSGQARSGYGFGAMARYFDVPITFDHGHSLVTGRFTDDDRDDVVASGGLRAAGSFSAVVLHASGDCAFQPGGAEQRTGAPATARDLSLAVGDLNKDGFDDVVALHREQGELRVFVGSGTPQLGGGPVVVLESSDLALLGLGVDGDRFLAATYAPREGRVMMVRLGPRP